MHTILLIILLHHIIDIFVLISYFLASINCKFSINIFWLLKRLTFDTKNIISLFSSCLSSIASDITWCFYREIKKLAWPIHSYGSFFDYCIFVTTNLLLEISCPNMNFPISIFCDFLWLSFTFHMKQITKQKQAKYHKPRILINLRLFFNRIWRER